MKISDIEKKLKNEHSGTAVPDVYNRVKKAPLNKLLSGESPAHAFQKRLALWLLSVSCVLFIVMAVALSALWFSSPNGSVLTDCYVSITLENDGGDVQEGGAYFRIGVLMRSDDSIVSITVEMENGVLNDSPTISYSSQISDFIVPINGDKVSIGVICADSMRGYALARKLVEDLRLMFENENPAIVAACNDYGTQLQMEQYIRFRGGDVRTSDGNEQMIKAYAALS